MLHLNKNNFMTPILISSLLSSLLLVGCGDSDTTSPEYTDLTLFAPVSTATSGQLVDSYVQNADYVCADGSEGITDVDGRFTCEELPVTFKLGELTLGEISTISPDNQVFPQDLLNVDRNDTQHPDVVAMARFLQSCDDDDNKENGLHIRQSVKDDLTVDEDFNADNIESYVDITVDEESAIEHLTQSTDFADVVTASDLPTIIKDALLSVNLELNQETKNTISYMGNEERLAYDVYNKMDSFFPEVMQFSNIAQNSERQHITAVQLLIKKYSIDHDDFTNIDLTPLNYIDTNIDDMDAGVYDISVIQDLYNTLVSIGEESSQRALEVGCMVEVTDINDLDIDIAVAEENNTTDVVTIFNFLRDGSYSHYWSFDNGLVNLGISDGCCFLGDTYCHPEYPTNENGGADADHGTGVETQDHNDSEMGHKYGK